jgi:nitrogen fixation protein FixH
MSSGFRLKGWHVLASLLGFFGVITAANAIFITYAIRSFPGQQVEKSYLQGLRFNEEIAARERQTALGWSARVVEARTDGAVAMFEIVIVAGDGTALSGLQVSGELRRPASDREDQVLVFSDLGDGRYRVETSGLAAGAYDLSARAVSPRGEEFKFAKRLML